METDLEKKAIKMPCTCCHRGNVLLEPFSQPFRFLVLQPCRECLYEPSDQEIHGFLTRRIKDANT